MYILGFIILFVIIGFFIGKNIEDQGFAYGLIILITVAWAFIFGPWAIATIIELSVGYALGARFSNISVSNHYEAANYIESDPVPDTNPEVAAYKDKQEDELHKAYLKYLDGSHTGKILSYEEFKEKDKRAEEFGENVAAFIFGKDNRSPNQKILDEIQEKKSERTTNWIIFIAVALIIIFHISISS